VSPSVVEKLDRQDHNYECVDGRVREFFLKYKHSSMLQSFVESVVILMDDVSDGILSLRKCKELDIVYLDRGNNPQYFLF